MIFLVGVHHERQHNGIGSKKNEDNQDFVKYIKEYIFMHNITLIAEEFSEEALLKSAANESTLKRIAWDLGIDHRFCDPNSDERKTLCIPSNKKLQKKLQLSNILNGESLKKLEEEQKKYFKVREEFWLKRLKDQPKANVIFICGIQHLESFHALLNQNSFKSIILDEKF